MKKLTCILRNESGFINIDGIAILGVALFVIVLAFQVSETPKPVEDFATTQTATADVEQLDVFQKIEKDVAYFKSESSYMTSEEKKKEGDALLERIEILLLEAGTTNQNVVDRLLLQEQQMEDELAYGL